MTIIIENNDNSPSGHNYLKRTISDLNQIGEALEIVTEQSSITITDDNGHTRTISAEKLLKLVKRMNK